jgi:putative ABC transport system permease protein
MLRQEFPTTGQRVRIPRWCVAACAVGVSLMAFAAVEFHNSPRRLESQSGSPDGTVHNFYGPQNHQTLWTVLMSVGAALSLVGIARLCPALLARVGQLGSRLPFALRLPVRDVGRQRHRTAPVTAAIATAIAGTVLVLFLASSTNVRDRHNYVAAFPPGTVSVEAHGDPAQLSDFTNTVARSLHAEAAGTAAWVTSNTTFNQLGVQTPACRHGHENALGCDFGLPMTAVDSSYVDAVVGHHVSQAAAMLAHGGAVVLRPNLAQDGRVSIAQYTLSDGDSGTPVTTPLTQLPALVLPPVPATQRVPDVLIAPATAAAHNWKTEPAFGLVRPTTLPSSAELARIKHSLGDRANLRAERGYQTKYRTLALALIAAAAFVLLAGTTVTVALAMAESGDDLAILRAVGASGIRRRLYAMGQAGTVGIIGVVIGLALGSSVGLALQIGSRDYPLSIPIGWLAITASVSEALAVVMAGALTTSRTPLPRRAA